MVKVFRRSHMMMMVVVMMRIVRELCHGIVVVIEIVDKGGCSFDASIFFGLQKGRESILLRRRLLVVMTSHAGIVKGTRVQ